VHRTLSASVLRALQAWATGMRGRLLRPRRALRPRAGTLLQARVPSRGVPGPRAGVRRQGPPSAASSSPMSSGAPSVSTSAPRHPRMPCAAAAGPAIGSRASARRPAVASSPPSADRSSAPRSRPRRLTTTRPPRPRRTPPCAPSGDSFAARRPASSAMKSDLSGRRRRQTASAPCRPRRSSRRPSIATSIRRSTDATAQHLSGTCAALDLPDPRLHGAAVPGLAVPAREPRPQPLPLALGPLIRAVHLELEVPVGVQAGAVGRMHEDLVRPRTQRRVDLARS